MERLRPILFSTPMVQAILSGRKTQTRRVILHYGKTPKAYGSDNFYKIVAELNNKPFFGAGFYKDSDIFEHEGTAQIDAIYFKAKCQPGDILWVRETWGTVTKGFGFSAYDEFIYKANHMGNSLWEADDVKWRPSIHMPKAAARLFLRVEDVHVERIQDIRASGAIMEGACDSYTEYEKCIPAFIKLWNSINEKRGFGWSENPWVWVIEFERISGRIDEHGEFHTTT